MTDTRYDFVCQQMKDHNIDIALLTNMINAWLDKQTHVCDQEMMNYIIKNEPMPEEVEKALGEIFDFDVLEKKGSPVAAGQLSLFEEGKNES